MKSERKFKFPRLLRRRDSSSNEPRRARVQMAQDGLLALVVAGLMTFSAMARGINLLMALGAFFVGFLAIDYLWGKRNLRELKVSRKLPDAVYAGEPFYVEIELDASEKRSSARSLVVEDAWEPESSEYELPKELKKVAPWDGLGADESSGNSKSSRRKANRAKKRANRARLALEASKTDAALSEGVETSRPVVYFPQIRKRSVLKEYYVGVFARRGVRRLKSLTLSTRFPCGFFRALRRFDVQDEIVVFPKVGRLTRAWDEFVEGKSAREEVAPSSLTSRIPDETIAIRDWREGDSKRTIAWRATAKRGKLQSRDFARRRARAVLLVLDLCASDKLAKDPARRWLLTEKAISFVETLIKRGSEQGDSRLCFALNADVPELSSQVGKRGGVASWNDAPDDWDEIAGGGSTRRASTRLALALPPKEDRLRETLRAANARRGDGATLIVASLEPLDFRRLGDDPVHGAIFVSVSAPDFDEMFRME
ncbi:MAG: DUF58 domain-containing protein [Thermoguttaceae bacterium]|nr:DUF58 domain-containing protein [Thermoguttaceae bacterium]